MTDETSEPEGITAAASGDVAVEVPPSYDDGHMIAVTYAGGDPVMYEVVGGRVEVSQKHLAEFLAAVEGAKPAP